jgi:hypothetical protein
MKLRYKDQIIVPFESFYRRASKGFCKGSIGGGQSRCVKCDDDLTILEVIYEDKDNRLCLEKSAERSSL